MASVAAKSARLLQTDTCSSTVQYSGVQKGNRESHSAIDISQLWCAFYRLLLCIWVESSICNCALCRVRWTMRKYRAIGGFNAVERCARLQWAANLRGNADAAVCSDQLRTCRDLCANCICPNCKKYLSKFQNVFVQIAKVFFQVSKYICPWC